MRVKTPDADVGVIIGRFQVPDLHEGHRGLIDSVVNKHKKVLMFICSTPGVLVTRRNPLDYFTRMMMVQEHYPNIAILPLHDMPSDDEWSRTVDRKIQETFGDHSSVVLYGSRDAFIPYYSGKFPTVELAESFDISGTAVREAASNEVRKHSEFRRGVVYAAHNKHPATFPTVDIALYKIENDGRELHIALGRKKTDPRNKWRFPGGFVDPAKDDTIEHAAKRELLEELGANINCTEMRYVASQRINDWRYRNEVDQIVTTFFATRLLWGGLQAGDDLDEAKWLDLRDFDLECMVEDHKPLMEKFMEWFRQNAI